MIWQPYAPTHPALPDTRAVVLQRWKVLYALTPKAACTSLLWLFASVQQERLAAIRTSLAPEVTRGTVIHDFSVWRHTRTLRQLTEADWQPVADRDDWFVFCVTRHPLARLWSAWQSKLLLREPYRRHPSPPARHRTGPTTARPNFPRIPRVISSGHRSRP